MARKLAAAAMAAAAVALFAAASALWFEYNEAVVFMLAALLASAGLGVGIATRVLQRRLEPGRAR